MTEYPALLRSVIAGKDLSAEDAAWVIGGIMDETISPVRTAALFAALAAKGEAAAEIVGAARAMRERCVRVEHGLPLVLDIVGTGGDGALDDQHLNRRFVRRGGLRHSRRQARQPRRIE